MCGSGAVSCSCSLLIRGPILPAVRQKLHLSPCADSRNRLSETTPDEVHAKEAAYAGLRRGDDWERTKWACDLWTAAFFAPLTKEGISAVPTTRHVWEAASGHLPEGRLAGVATELAVRQPFFHWPLEFPEVFAGKNPGSEPGAGFDVMLGNPPWERIKLS